LASKTRLSAILAVLLVGALAIVVAGCGGSSSSSSSTTTETEESTETAGAGDEEAGGGETLTVGSDIPYPRSSRKPRAAATRASTSN
jgi:hypothetical protein